MGHLLGVHRYKNMELVLALACLLVMGASFYVEYAIDLLPCPLCVMQRFCVILLLVCTLLGFRFFKKRILLLQAIIAIMGSYFAMRQLWLEMHFMDDTGMCLPWQNTLSNFFWGGSDCGATDITIAGLSMAGWSSIFFVVVLIITNFIFFKLWRAHRG
jgi:disulfide bond formation protein DsbB